MVWDCFVGRRKGSLIIWNKDVWGKIINVKGFQTHIIPHLDLFCNNETVRTNDYV